MSFPHFSILESNAVQQTLVAEINDIDVAIVNSLRRVILSEIPNVAIAFDAYHPEESDITFVKNTTSLHNEFMGLRISLIPLHLSRTEIENWDDTYSFVINVHNTSNATIDVTSKDIQVFDKNGDKVSSSVRDRIFPPNHLTKDYIVITKLKPNLYNKEKGEHFHVEFKARKGIAKTHARWCTVSLCTYQNKVDEKAANQALQLALANAGNEDKNKVLNRFETLEKYRYFVKNSYDEPSAFVFKMESECNLKPSEVLTIAFDVLIEKLQNIITMPDKMTFDTIQAEQGMYSIMMHHEDHTLANLLQSLVYNMFIRNATPETKAYGLEYIGYYQPHPLESDVVFKVKFTKEQSTKRLENFVHYACELLSNHVSALKAEWIACIDNGIKDDHVSKKK
jgi:DNA-directed RNA polymerase subunit D